MEKEEIIKNKTIYSREVFIYFLIKDDIIVYVGQTAKGMSRIQAHEGNKDFNAYTIINCDKDELDELENHYILKFNPIYNKMINTNDKYISRQGIRKLGINGCLLNRLIKVYEIKYANNNYKLYDRSQIILALKKYIDMGNAKIYNSKYYLNI